MAEETWQPARLIPTSGITGQDEAERRATSALLAVVGSVREFGLAIVKPLGAPAGHLSTFIEVPFELADKTVYPDGAIESARGGRTWMCLVEVKTGTAELGREQLECYLDVARERGFDAVLTISNQIATTPGGHPVDVDKRKLKKVGLFHLSWAEVMTIAVQQRVHRGVSDPDQAWILGELIRYLEHPRSGALDFTDMGQAWVGVRESVLTGTLRATDKGLQEVVARWEQLLRFAALRLGRELGSEVHVVYSRKEASEPGVRMTAQSQELARSGQLVGALRVPDAASDLDVVADLRAGRVLVSCALMAPKEGRPQTRVTWLTRQLPDAPEGLRIDAFAANARQSSSELLGKVRDNPACLVQDATKELRSFRVLASSTLGTKRGVGRGGFIDSVLASIDGFYGGVLENLRVWTAKAPKLPSGSKTAVEEAGVDISPPDSDVSDKSADAIAEAEEQLESGGPEAVSEGESISWDAAHAKLDRERALSQDEGPLATVGSAI